LTGKNRLACYAECKAKFDSDGCAVFEIKSDGTCNLFKNPGNTMCGPRYNVVGSGVFHTIVPFEYDMNEPHKTALSGDATGAIQVLFKNND
jgi:hypothetical protein